MKKNNKTRKSKNLVLKPRSAEKSRKPRLTVVKNPTGSRQKDGFGETNSWRVEKEELVGNVTSNGAEYRVTQYSVNPTNLSMFKWLADRAKGFVKYRFHKLEFRYRPFVTEYQPIGLGIGRVVLNANYNAATAPPEDIVAIEDSNPRVDGRPVEHLLLSLSAKEMHDGDAKYLRQDDTDAYQDAKTLNVAVLNVATYSQTATGVLGQIYVKYDVTLSEMRTESILKALMPIRIPISNYEFVSGATYPDNTSYVVEFTPLYGATFQTSSTTLTLPPGYYWIQVSAYYSSTDLYEALMDWNLDGALVNHFEYADGGSTADSVQMCHSFILRVEAGSLGVLTPYMKANVSILSTIHIYGNFIVNKLS